MRRRLFLNTSSEVFAHPLPRGRGSVRAPRTSPNGGTEPRALASGLPQTIATLCLATALALPLAAQTTPPPFKVDVKMVRLVVNVKDAKGELVGSLESKDFTVYDCGVKQEVAHFEAQTDQPLSVSVLIDISGSTLKDVAVERTSIAKFFKALLGSGNVKDAA